MKDKKEHITSIGGQAVIEGVMMRGPKGTALAVRKSDGEIHVEQLPVGNGVSKYKILRWPLIRGVVNLILSLVIGIKALTRSADFMDLEDDSYKPSKFEEWLDRKFGDKIKDIVIYFAVFISLIFSIGLFILLPTVIASVFTKIPGLSGFVKTLLEGVIRITIFLVYIILISKMEDIKRVFEYHGAEHKTIFAYEHGEELTPENVRKYSRLHPRCGTSFLVFVMIISIIVFSFLSWENVFIRIASRLLLLPVVAGISYEIIKWAGRSNSKIVQLLSKPGMWLQYLTTREPDDSQLEVAIASLNAVRTDNSEDDKW